MKDAPILAHTITDFLIIAANGLVSDFISGHLNEAQFRHCMWDLMNHLKCQLARPEFSCAVRAIKAPDRTKAKEIILDYFTCIDEPREQKY